MSSFHRLPIVCRHLFIVFTSSYCCLLVSLLYPSCLPVSCFGDVTCCTRALSARPRLSTPPCRAAPRVVCGRPSRSARDRGCRTNYLRLPCLEACLVRAAGADRTETGPSRDVRDMDGITTSPASQTGIPRQSAECYEAVQLFGTCIVFLIIQMFRTARLPMR